MANKYLYLDDATGRINGSTTQPINSISGLQTALDAKEPVFTKNTGFNLNLGTTAGTVSEGDHTHLVADVTNFNTVAGAGLTWSGSVLDVDALAVKRIVLHTTTAQNAQTTHDMTWDTQEYIDTDVYSHSTVTNNHQITVLVAGIYKIRANTLYNNTGANRFTLGSQIRVNGVTYDPSYDKSYSSGLIYSGYLSTSSTATLSLAANDVIHVQVIKIDADQTTAVDKYPANCEFVIERIGTEAITNTWRAIHDTPVDAATTTSISSNWAYDLLNSAQTIAGVWTFNNNVTIGNASTDILHISSRIDSRLDRSTTRAGYLCGSHAIASSSTHVNPIYVIGETWAPESDTTLNNTYGIGFTTELASFINSTDLGSAVTSGAWGQYIAADGNARIFLDATNGNGHFKNKLDAQTLAVRGATTIGTTLGVTGTTTHTGLLIADGGSKLVIQDEVDGGQYRGIRMWTDIDPNWGIYMATNGTNNNLAGSANAVASIDGRTQHHIRFRVANNTTTGFIWENSSDVALMSLTGDTGDLYVLGNVTAPTFTGALTGNADTASAWAASRTLTLSGDVAGSVSFDGSGAINMTNTVVANDSHTHTVANISNADDDVWGLVAAGASTETDFNTLNTRTQAVSINATTNTPFGASWYTVLSVGHRNGGGTDGANFTGQIAMGMTTFNNRIAYRNQDTGVWGSWVEFWTTDNLAFGTIAGSMSEGDHLHDDRYYTETEANSLFAETAGANTFTQNQTIAHATLATTLDVKANATNTNAYVDFLDSTGARIGYVGNVASIPTLGGITAWKFLITPNVNGTNVMLVGDVPTAHTHDDRYYTETESDGKYLLNTTDTLAGTLTATTFVGALTGNADTSTLASKVTVTNNTGADVDYPVVWHNGSDALFDTETTFTFRPLTGNLKTTSIETSGSITVGNVARIGSDTTGVNVMAGDGIVFNKTTTTTESSLPYIQQDSVIIAGVSSDLVLSTPSSGGGIVFSTTSGNHDHYINASGKLFIADITASASVTVGTTLTVTGASTLNGDVTLGDAITDTVTFTAYTAGDIIPSVTNTDDIGSSTNEYKDQYLKGSSNYNNVFQIVHNAATNSLDFNYIGAA